MATIKFDTALNMFYMTDFQCLLNKDVCVYLEDTYWPAGFSDEHLSTRLLLYVNKRQVRNISIFEFQGTEMQHAAELLQDYFKLDLDETRALMQEMPHGNFPASPVRQRFQNRPTFGSFLRNIFRGQRP